MSTVYSLIYTPTGQERNLGYSSSGWTFGLRQIPDWGIFGLEELQLAFMSDDFLILDEYGRELSPDQFIEVVTDRRKDRDWDSDWWKIPRDLIGQPIYGSEVEFHHCNSSMRGPNGLLRRQILSPYVISHGSGTWDVLEARPC